MNVNISLTSSKLEAHKHMCLTVLVGKDVTTDFIIGLPSIKHFNLLADPQYERHAAAHRQPQATRLWGSGFDTGVLPDAPTSRLLGGNDIHIF